ncbi:hypothetical protein Q8A73_012534 [Channa argus]|nr:hypothetical protein Q8A73_012534 [Channa argus]
MHPADTYHLQRVVSSQSALLGQHDQQLRRIEEGVDRYTQLLSQVTDTLNALCSHVTISAASPEPPPPLQPPAAPAICKSYVPPLEPFFGNLDKCRGFLLQYCLVFTQQPHTYASDAGKVAYFIGLLRGRALEWAEVVSSLLIPFHLFINDLRKAFDHPACSENAAHRLLSLRQGFRSVADFSVEFRVLATEARWDNAALWAVFRHAPAPQDLRTPPLPKSPISPGFSSSAPPEAPAEPMELVRARLSPTEKQRRFQAAPFPNCRSPPVDTSPTPDMSLIPQPIMTSPQSSIKSPVTPSPSPIRLCYRSPAWSAITQRSPLQPLSPRKGGHGEIHKGVSRGRPHPPIFLPYYWGLNNITVKNKYPLPLLNSAFESLQDAAIFTKLDLHNAYHLVRIREGNESDPEKTRAVTEWPRPGTRKQLQRILGFTNFYRQFIKNYSTVAAPLTKLTSPVTLFHWTEKAEGAFTRLKELFASPPILSQPDTSRQFVVEVDASEVGVGALLSQRSEGDQRLPCAFFSRQLPPAERNYSVCDRELLAIKLALEEWRHWLEGALQPFIIWTDHKNLAHLRTAKRLNSRQARFNLFLTYRPGSKNVKPNALSRIHAPKTSSHDPEPILRLSCLLGALTWEIGQTVRTAQQQEPWSPICPVLGSLPGERVSVHSSSLHWSLQLCRHCKSCRSFFCLNS